MANVRNGDVVVPGDRLCVIEELMPSFGTYEHDGAVFAATAGVVSMDMKARSIQVLNTDGRVKLALPLKGDIVIGEVSSVYDQRAEIAIARRNEIDVHNSWLGEVYIANVTRRYVKSMHDVIAVGDIVRAMVLTTHKIPVELSLVGPDLGVIYAKCRKCGHELVHTTHNNLACLACDNRETREVASDYGRWFGIEPRPDLAPRHRTYGSIQRPSAGRPVSRDRRSTVDSRRVGPESTRRDSHLRRSNLKRR
ncbi:MAG: exosome complex RNA-binding protein Csl4 [Candidatus Thorarchaeota archaeon]